MKQTYFLIFSAFFALALAGCSKSSTDPAPAADTALLTRKWAFPDVVIKTDAKQYATLADVIGDNNTITIKPGGTYDYQDQGKTLSGKWSLVDKTLTFVDADNEPSVLTITTLTSTNLDLAGLNVDLTKGNDLTDRKVYTEAENEAATVSLFLLASLDKSNGGTIDFTKEPEPKSVQLILKGKGI